MMPLNWRTITSTANARVKALAQLRKPRHARERGVFFAEGAREIRRALEAGLAPLALLADRSLMDERGRIMPAGDELHELDPGPAHVEAIACTPAVLEKLAYRQNPEGVLALFRRPQRSLADLEPAMPDRILVTDRIEKPGNLGAMMRSASAAGVGTVLVTEPGCDTWSPQVLRGSTGACFAMDVIECGQAEAGTWLIENGYTLIVADPRGTMRHDRIAPADRMAIVIGAEDRGLHPRWLEPHPRVVPTRIDMSPGPVDSLNASVTAALLLFALRPQPPGD
ncbi:MAG: RNA methyltransferase [Phycisphaeraceae bacterium]|nr:RNA methyltransferase [Phycisphaeraceae bacterium]